MQEKLSTFFTFFRSTSVPHYGEMSQTAVDTSYRSMSVATLEALRLSVLTQLKAVEGVGQSHSANGRQTTLVSLEKLNALLVNYESALEWKRNPANAGNNGYARRFASFNTCGDRGDYQY